MIPVLPDEISSKFDDATPASDAASDAEVAAFLDKHTDALRPEILNGWRKALENHFAEHMSRHGSTVSVLAGAMKEARAGFLCAADAIDTIRPMFLTEVAKPPVGSAQNPARTGKTAESEFRGILGWAVGQANAADLNEVHARVEEKMFDNQAWMFNITATSEEATAKDHHLCLPESFWERERLALIRQWAWSAEVPADSVLNSALAALSASIPPQVRVDTGIMRPVALHHLAGLAGPSGGGKTTMLHIGQECLLISPPAIHHGDWSKTAGMRCPDGVATIEDDRNMVPYQLPLGSGQGICEAYMGMEYGPAGANGKPGKPRRAQIRTNVLLFTDEGLDYVKACRDPKSSVGEVTRALWSGGDAGQGNATAEMRRILRRGEYTLAAVAGFQEGVLAEFLSEEELTKGTPQRWIQTWSIDPALPDETPERPDQIAVTVPTAPLTVERSITDRLRSEQKARARGHKRLPKQESHRPGAVVRAAALLTILDGRDLVSEEDVTLAEMLYDTSLRIMKYCRSLAIAEAEKARRSKRVTELVESIADAEMRGSDKGRAAVRILALLAKAGGRVKWSGKDGAHQRKFKGDDRKHADEGLTWLVEDRQMVHRVTEDKTVYIEAVGE